MRLIVFIENWPTDVHLWALTVYAPYGDPAGRVYTFYDSLAPGIVPVIIQDVPGLRAGANTVWLIHDDGREEPITDFPPQIFEDRVAYIFDVAARAFRVSEEEPPPGEELKPSLLPWVIAGAVTGLAIVLVARRR